MAGPGWVESSITSRWGARTHSTLSDDEKFFVENHERATTIAESSDPSACYSYDDWALAELDGVFYVFNTAGCSCPSPNETWDLQKKGTREEMLDYLVDVPRDYDTAFRAFLRSVQAAGWVLKEPAPGASGKRSDW